MYVHVNFGGQILNSLVDTGASLTVTSTRVWESSNLSKHGMLPEYNRTVVTASGAALEVKGKTTVSLQIREESYNADVIIADVENGILIGLGFMRRHGCTVDVESTSKVRENDSRQSGKYDLSNKRPIYSGTRQCTEKE